jgi:two-component system LytT family response regulator
MMRVLLVDDEPAARRGLRRLLAGLPDVAVVGECEDGEAAVAGIAALAPDLVFLDIQMPGLDGFGVIDAVGLARMPPVVFVTAYDEFALKAFEVHALDYLLKPVDEQRLQAVVERARARLPEAGADWAARLASTLETLGLQRPPRWCRRLAIRGNGRVVLLDVAEVDYVSAAGNYVEVHEGRKAHLLRETLLRLEARLDPERFARVSRSAIVNIDRVRELQPMFNGDFVVLLKDGTQVAGSRRHREALLSLLD